MKLDFKKFIKKNQQAALEEMMKVVSHDIRNPLSALKNGMHYLKYTLLKNDIDDRLKKNMEIIDTEIKSLTSLLEKQCEQVKRDPLDLNTINLNKIINTAMHICDIPEDIVVDNLIPETLTVKVDRWEITVLFFHFLNNAVQAVDKNKGRICIDYESRTPPESDTKKLFITIKDNGLGIKEKNLRKASQLFFSTKKSHTGLGLTIAKSILRRHGGKIDIASGKKEGAKVTFNLPV